MQKTKTTNVPKQADAFPAFEDFFTQFLDKKKKNYTKKLEKIDGLQKKNFDELTPEQKDLVKNRQKVVDDAAYYDEIKQLYFQASAKKEGQKQSNSSNSNYAILGLYYLGKFVNEHGESAMKVMAGFGIDFQEQVQKYNQTIFHADGFNSETLKKAENSLNEYIKDSGINSQINTIWAEDKLTIKVENNSQKRDNIKETTNKPQLFAMSSDEEDEEPVEEIKKQDVSATKTAEQTDNFKPTFVPLPENDNDEGFTFESNNRTRGDRRDRKPRGDRPPRKYDGERRGQRRDRENKDGDNKEGKNEVKGDNNEGHLDEKPFRRGKPSRGKEYDVSHEVNRESGERRKPFGRGRGKHYNKEHREDNTYQKKEAKIEKQGD